MFWNKNDKPALSPEPTMIRTSLAISLEPRMLFDGAVAATVAEAATAEASATPDADSSFDNQAAAPSSATSDQRQEVVFIDSSVKDNQQLLNSLASGTEVVVLDSSQDGLTQMAQYLNGRSGIDAIHLISHGGEANLLIGSARLNLDNIADAQNQLAAIGSSLTASGDFLIYGCDIAKGENGAAFISQLASLTGADVAASTDWTGDTNKGGDWTLEASTGTIESEVLFADTNYTHILNTLDAGDIVVLGWNAVDDTVTFATLVDIPAGTVIKITDKGWDQATNAFTPLSTGDGVVTWTTSGAISAGNIFTLFLGGADEPTTLTNVTTGAVLTSDISTSGFTVNDPMNIAGDSIFIYQDADNNPYFIFGMNNSAGVVDANGWNTSIAAGLRDSMTPNGNGSQNALTNGVNAIGLPGGASQQDNVQYTGATTAADRATWLARITNSANWTGDSSGSTATSVGVSGGSEVNILPPNIAPIISNLNGDSTTFTEGGNAVLLDVGSNATVTDADSADFDGGNVTVAITANGSPGEDVLAIRNEGTGTGQISVSGSTVSYGGTAIGTITSSGTGGAGLVVTLNASANAAAVQALIHNLTYANSNAADPSTAARTVSITVNDGDGGTSTAAGVTVNVTDVNDAPAITATGNNPTYTENGSAADLFSNVSINTVETGQTITGMTLTVTNLADGSNEILRIDGTDIALLAGSNGTTAGNGISYWVSINGGTATITLGSAGGLSAATAQNVVDGMGYRNSSDAPSTATRVITLTSITDSGGTANGGVDTSATPIATSVSVVAVNDAPIVTSSGGASSFTEGDGGTVIDSGLTLSDPDNATLSSATVSITGNFQSGDVLSFINDGSTMGNITASYDAGTGAMTLTSAGATATLAQWQAALRSVTYNNGSDAPSTANRTISFIVNDGQDDSAPATRTVSVTAVNDAPQITAPVSIGVTEDIPSAITGISFSDADAGSANVIVTLSIGSGTLSAVSGGGVTVGGTASALTLTGNIADINSFINGSNLSFTTAANATADVTLTVNINDGGNTGDGGAKNASETITLQVAAVNDAPTITAPGFIDITEDLPGALTGISFTDVDAGSGNVTATFSVPSGTLSAISGNGVTVGGTASALTLTGSLADINAFIAASGISFTTASNATANVTLTVTIDDGGNTGSGGAQTDTTSVTLMVTAVNDAPVNNVPVTQSTDRGADLVFNSANGNLISISDVDAGAGNLEVTLSASNGLVSLSDVTGLSFSLGTGTLDGIMTFTGSLAAINAALNGLAFIPDASHVGAASLQITTSDLGNSGSGGAMSDSDTIDITVNPVPPQVLGVQAISPDGSYKAGDVITLSLTFDQAVEVIDGTPTLLLETGTTDREAVYVSGSGSDTLVFEYTVQAGDESADLDYHSTTALSLNGASILGAGNENAILTLPATGGTDSIAGQHDLQIDTQVPVNSLPGAQTTNTLTPVVFSSDNGNAISVAENGQLTTVVSVTSGSLSATSGGGASITGNGTASLTLSGTAAQVNAALEGLVYKPAAAGSYTLNVESTDSAGNSDSDEVVITVENSTLVVTSNLDTGVDASVAASYAADLADGGGLSIREALYWARAGDIITFDLDAGAAGSQGGTIVLDGGQLSVSYSNLTINGDLNGDGVADITLSGNNASRVLSVDTGLSNVELIGLHLTQGSDVAGAGLAIGFNSSVMLRDSMVTDNHEPGIGGGGIYGSNVMLTMINTTVSGNTSGSFGGGMRIVGGSILNIYNSTITNNTSDDNGGGIQYAGPALTIVNSTISGNTAQGNSEGGGLRISSGTATIYNSTIVGNAAGQAGGGVSAAGTETFINTVVAGNTSGAGATAAAGGSPLATGGIADDVSGAIENAISNYFGTHTTVTAGGGNLNDQGTANLLLGNLAYNNGSAVQTHRPQAGSALIDAGSNADLPTDSFDLDGNGNTAELLPIDANGNTRVSNIVDIGAVESNSVPVLTDFTGGGTFVENGAPIVIDSDASVSDTEFDLLNGGNGDYSGASLVIARTGGIVATDSFGFNSGNGISLTGGNLIKNGQVIASFDTGTAGQLVITFTNANGEIPTRADVNAVLRQLTYSSSSEDPGSSASLDLTFIDEAGGSVSANASLTIIPVNDAPTLSATGATSVFIENGAAVNLFSGVNVGTVETGQTIIGLTLSMAGLADGNHEILIIDGTDIVLAHGSSGITSGSYGLDYSVDMAGGTATITLGKAGGLDSADTTTLIEAISYRNTSEAPTGISRAITLAGIQDSGGTANGGVDALTTDITATVTIGAVNDAPVIDAPATITVTEDISSALTGISFSDPDAGTASVTVSLSVTSGSLSAISGSGVTVGGTSSAMTLSGNIANINAFIAGNNLSFTTDSDATSDVQLSIGINDGGNSGSGGALTDSVTVIVSVTAINDAPVNHVPATQSIDRDADLVFNAANGNLISVSDVDVGAGNLEVTLSASNGLISLSGVTGLVFSQGNGISDVTMTFTGSVGAINAALDGLVFTPSTGYHGTASLQITTSDLGNSGSGGAQTDTDTLAITVNPLNPEITGIGTSSADGSYKLGDTITLTMIFDQVVFVDTAGGVPTLLLETGSIDRNAVYVSGSGSDTLTFSYTVQAGDEATDLDYHSSTALSLNGGSIENINGSSAILTLPASGSSDSLAGQHDLLVDGVLPTASIVVADTALVAGETTTVTITFSEAVSGLDIADFNVANGSLGELSSNDGGVTWTATLTPDTNIEDTSNLITLDNTGYTDAAGNTGSGTTDSNNYAIDTQRPTASIVVSDTALSAGETATVTITFNEAVTGLTTADFSVANGSLSGLSSSDGGITWTATLTPDANIVDTSNLIILDNTGYTDAAGNTGSGTTDSNNYAIDTQRPTASIVVSDTALSVGESSTVTITFSEAVSGLTVSDFAVANGTLSGLSSSDGGITWTATLTPDTNIEDTSNLITLDNTGYIDAAGNTGTGTTDSNNYAIDTQRPTASIVVSDTALAAGETTTVTITFSEAVSGLDTADFSVANGTLSGLSSSDGGITWAATLTPYANIEDTSNLITLDNTGVTDLAGNAGSGTTDSNNYAIDTQRPTASIVVSDTALAVGETATVTITFSEAVTGLTTADFSVANGSLSGLSSSDGGITWTATLTPDTNIEDTSNLITLDNTGVQDAAGNSGTGTTDSNSYAIDTQRPAAVSIVVGDLALAAGETTTVTITFSEVVSGLDLADFTVANATLSGLSSSDGGITWTATLTPSANVENAANLITLNNAGYTDVAGNTGSGTTDSNSYAIDTLRPTASIVVSDTALAVGETSTITITFSEAVTGLDLADFSVANGVLSGLSSSDGGITWTATLTPDANIEDTSNLITLDNTGVTDLAGNAGSGTTDSNNYVIDTQIPTVNNVSVPLAIHYSAGDTLTFVVNTSEVVIIDGTPRLVLDIGGTMVFADYVAGSGTNALVFQYSVQAGLNDADGIAVNGLEINGGSLHDVSGNAMDLTLNNVGDTSGVIVDTTAPSVSAIVTMDPSPTNARTVRYTVTFSEDVSGVDLSDFGLVTTGNVIGNLGNLVQIDGRTYQVTINDVAGNGTLALALADSGTLITDAAGNALTSGLIGQSYILAASTGDPEFRSYPPSHNVDTPSVSLQPALPSVPPPTTTSPLLPPPLFEVPTLGSGIPTLGNIFINQNPLAPSYIAQVFASSSDVGGDGSGIGFLGFGGGDGGVFGSSSLSSLFGQDVLQESEQLEVFDGKKWGAGHDGGIFGAPTLGQQLNDLREGEQSQLRELAQALQQIAAAQSPS